MTADDDIPTDDIVMAQLHQIIYFSACANAGSAQRAAIDTGIGADFNMIVNLDMADMRHFNVLIIAKFVAETVCADDGAGMKNHIVADHAMVVNDHITGEYGSLRRSRHDCLSVRLLR